MLGVVAGGGHHSFCFCGVISIENLLHAWLDFRKNKRSKTDVSKFELNLENNLFELHNQLVSNKWEPDPYEKFVVYDPKPRIIHKASVRDRVLYQAVYKQLYQIFDKTFIFHSYSSRNFKGIYAGIKSLEESMIKISGNYIKPCHILKCDIRKFFDSVDHNILFRLISHKIMDKEFLYLIKQILFSFEKTKGKGLPLGNVTSQIFSNIYLNELDQYIKHKLKAKYYFRYCDDFVLVSDSKEYLQFCVREIELFCHSILLLDLHAKKIIFRKAINGVDFLGYVLLPYRKVLRTKTKNRMIKKLSKLKNAFGKGLFKRDYLEKVAQSYLGLISHCKSGYIKEQIERVFWD